MSKLNKQEVQQYILKITREFREASGQILSHETAIRNVYEEAFEVADAVEEFLKYITNVSEPERDGDKEVELVAHILKELSDFTYVMIQADDVIPEGTTGVYRPNAQEETDLILTRLWMQHTVGGVIPDEVLLSCISKVHESNMSKAGPDGEFVRNPETGKILKGEHYLPPDLTDEATDVVDDIITFVNSRILKQRAA